MRYEIWNFGPSRKFRCPAGNIQILRGSGFETEDKTLADSLHRFPKISVKELETPDGLDKMPMHKLLHLAAENGITNPRIPKKKVLIGQLRGVL